MSIESTRPGPALERELAELRRRIESAEQIHRAIVDNEVDGFVVGREDAERRVLLLGEAQLRFQQEVRNERERRQQLESVDRQRSEFLAMLGHEMRSPLGALVNGLEILRRSADLEPRMQQVLEMMGRQTLMLSRLLDDLLDVYRLEQGKVLLRTQRIDLALILAEAAEGARAMFEARKHSLEIALAPGPIWVDADAVRLTQVVNNLLQNAARYTDEGGRIRLSLEEQTGSDGRPSAAFRVIDNGIGIAPDQLARVFEPFDQLGRTDGRGSGGLGLGLAICRRLIELHGGRIECRSDGVGSGSEFTVELPIAER